MFKEAMAMSQSAKTTAFICALLAVGVADLARAQTWPTKPVHVIVPFAGGGPPAIIGRLRGQRLRDAWGQPIVQENRPGAGGDTGAAHVSKAAPDGYTVLVTTSSSAVNATLSPNPGYDLERDLAAVAHVATSPNIFLAGAGSGIGTLSEAIDKAKGGKFNFGSPGSGTTNHLSAEYLFRVLAKTNATHIPYKAAGPAVTAALAGEVELGSVAVPGALPLVKAGKLHGLAVTAAKRIDALPDVPTVEESGYPDFRHYTWVAVFMPARTPASVVSRMNADIEKLLAQPEFRGRLTALAFDTVGGSTEDVARYVRA